MSSHVTTEKDSSSSTVKKRVKFNEYGLPVGENSKQLSTRDGVLVRAHILVSFEDWRGLPEHMKEDLWKLLGGLSLNLSGCHCFSYLSNDSNNAYTTNTH